MKVRVSWFAVLFGLYIGACGGDEPTGAPAGQTGAGTGAATSGSPALTGGTTAPAAGSGGVSTAAGTGAATAGTGTASAGTGASAAVMCGTLMCQPAPPNPGLSKTPPVACCADVASSQCGNIVNGTCTPPPPPAPNCPTIAFSQARTCCVPATNTCGIDASAYGMGCLDVSSTMGGLKTPCGGAGAAGGGATAGASGAAAGVSGAAAGASGAAAGASGSAAGAGGASAGAGGR